MNIELVTIGTELLLGFTLDSNGAEIARMLSANGVEVARRTAVPDRGPDIADAVLAALRRTGAVLTTGGLGPTRDDISKKAVADLFGAPLEFDQSVWGDLLARFARMQRVPVASNRSQAEVPRGATVLRNRWGTAPGLWLEASLSALEGRRGLVIMLPGVPSEMRKLMEHEVLPRLAPMAAGKVIRSRVVRTTGIPESTLAERMGDIEREIAPLTLAYLPGPAGVDLRLSAWGLDPEETETRLAAGARLLHDRAGEHAYGEDDTDLAAVVLQLARERGCRLGVAESCTGGLLGARLTEIPGSSDVFDGGVICYSNRVKTELLGVSPTLIVEQGAVSEAVARAMAEGARKHLAVELAAAVTGVAGPGGGTTEKPVGTVWIAVADAHGSTARHSVFPGSRQEIRSRAAQGALSLLRRRLAGVPSLSATPGVGSPRP
jgi:nicotinamide-nucleotide amidase